MSKNKSYNKWTNLIINKLKWENAPFTESEVIYLRKAIGPSGLKDRDLAYDLSQHFTDLMPRDGYNITLEHQQKGIDYLRDNTFKKSGKLRKNNIFNEYCINILNNYKEFKFVGLHEQVNFYGYSSGHVLPIYRCIAEDGTYFDYTGTMYSMIEVLDHGSINLKLEV